ncbi:MAG: 1-acyl-sn-glycerol-3-phosphate acyltransferase [Deltaproteobacteria bacterium]|nr:1-acyl-sn-glycerol-3-phosphate acyltransferase [Deltaproteobacteria bacterium]
MSIYGGRRRPLVVWLTRFFIRIIFPFFFKIRIRGLENLPLLSSFILFPKHQRWEDIPIIGLVVPKPLYYIAKHELFINPVSSYLISSMGGIPLNRKRPRESYDAIINMLDRLKDGEGVVIFPEGTYFEGYMGPGKTGLLRMIQPRLGFPFVPVGIRYARQGMRTRVFVHFGKPVTKDLKEVIGNFSDLIMKEIARLSGLK